MLQPCGPTATVIGKEFPAARSPTKKPTRAFFTACWRRSAVANLSGRRQNWTLAHSIAPSPETEMLRLLSFAVFFGVWWGAALLAGAGKRPPPPAVLAAAVAEASSGALFLNLGVTLARVALAFTLAMTLGAAIGYLMGRVRLCNPLGGSLPVPLL